MAAQVRMAPQGIEEPQQTMQWFETTNETTKVLMVK